jgi:very-short-patch-repair endonuclease/predicted transcriptional regulator of viral defense system
VASESASLVRKLVPPHLDEAIAGLAVRQHGVVALAQLRELGLSARAVQARAARGRLHRLYRGVYAVGHVALTVQGRRMAAVLACGPAAVLSHRSAAAAWGLRPTSRARLEVSTTARGCRGAAGIDVHRPRRIEPEDVDELDGVPITSVARTLVDLAAVLGPDALERAVHQAEVLQLLDVRQVDAALARSAGRRGTGRLRAIVREPSPGTTRSELEERFLALCRLARLPVPRLNLNLPTSEGLVEVDACWPMAQLVVELDGAAAHRTSRAFHADRRRDAALAAQGYVVVRLTWERVTREADAVADEIRRILARRRAVVIESEPGLRKR